MRLRKVYISCFAALLGAVRSRGLPELGQGLGPKGGHSGIASARDLAYSGHEVEVETWSGRPGRAPPVTLVVRTHAKFQDVHGFSGF